MKVAQIITIACLCLAVSVAPLSLTPNQMALTTGLGAALVSSPFIVKALNKVADIDKKIKQARTDKLKRAELDDLRIQRRAARHEVGVAIAKVFGLGVLSALAGRYGMRWWRNRHMLNEGGSVSGYQNRLDTSLHGGVVPVVAVVDDKTEISQGDNRGIGDALPVDDKISLFAQRIDQNKEDDDQNAFIERHLRLDSRIRNLRLEREDDWRSLHNYLKDWYKLINCLPESLCLKKCVKKYFSEHAEHWTYFMCDAVRSNETKAVELFASFSREEWAQNRMLCTEHCFSQAHAGASCRLNQQRFSPLMLSLSLRDNSRPQCFNMLIKSDQYRILPSELAAVLFKRYDSDVYTQCINKVSQNFDVYTAGEQAMFRGLIIQGRSIDQFNNYCKSFDETAKACQRRGAAETAFFYVKDKVGTVYTFLVDRLEAGDMCKGDDGEDDDGEDDDDGGVREMFTHLFDTQSGKTFLDNFSDEEFFWSYHGFVRSKVLEKLQTLSPSDKVFRVALAWGDVATYNRCMGKQSQFLKNAGKDSSIFLCLQGYAHCCQGGSKAVPKKLKTAFEYIISDIVVKAQTQRKMFTPQEVRWWRRAPLSQDLGKSLLNQTQWGEQEAAKNIIERGVIKGLGPDNKTESGASVADLPGAVHDCILSYLPSISVAINSEIEKAFCYGTIEACRTVQATFPDAVARMAGKLRDNKKIGKRSDAAERLKLLNQTV